jgi:TatD DNase family protein
VNVQYLPLPPLDVHAHVDAGIPPEDLEDLGAVVVAVTRTLGEYSLASKRVDRSTIWAVGCHPGLPEAIAAFDDNDFRSHVQRAAFVGEVGLDGKSSVPLEEQVTVLTQVLRVLADVPRPVSIHSAGQHRLVLDLIEKNPSPGIILHWWTGDRATTERAVALGCSFSVNGATSQHRIAAMLPPERLLTETDFPYTNRADHDAFQPGSVATTESMLKAVWQRDGWGVRSQIWRNFAGIITACHSGQLLPESIRRLVVAA